MKKSDSRKLNNSRKKRRRRQQKQLKKRNLQERELRVPMTRSAARRAERKRKQLISAMHAHTKHRSDVRELSVPCAFWKFDPEVMELADDLAKVELSDGEIREEMPYRRDFSQLPTITIDGEDAKDLDDAIDIETTPDGYRLYVHIADVDHFVRPHSILDKVAARRGNSIYLVDRVIPMLPPGLSNGICSLHEGVFRLTLSVVIDFDSQGRPLREEVCESFIRNKRRCNYREIQEILDNDLENAGMLANLLPPMCALRDAIKQRRDAEGMLNFNFAELKFDLDENKQPVRVRQEYQSYAQSIIEMFMIEANEAIARIALKYNLPIVYRVHEKPDRQKIAGLRNLMKSFRINKKLRSDSPKPLELQAVLNEVQEIEGGQVLSTLALRALTKARYAAENLGHYGLATTSYCHFTSPIRRYSDTFTHRVIKKFLAGQRLKRETIQVERVADHVSRMERVAIEAERDSVAEYACRYYRSRLGEVDWGEICGFSNYAVFLRLSTGVEGSILFSSLPSGYRYDPQTMTAVRRHTGEVMEYGQQLPVQIAAVNVERRFIDLELADENLLTSSGL